MNELLTEIGIYLGSYLALGLCIIAAIVSAIIYRKEIISLLNKGKKEEPEPEIQEADQRLQKAEETAKRKIELLTELRRLYDTDEAYEAIGKLWNLAYRERPE